MIHKNSKMLFSKKVRNSIFISYKKYLIFIFLILFLYCNNLKNYTVIAVSSFSYSF